MAQGDRARWPRRTPIALNAIIYRYFQEPNNEKTNNGIHYKLQLLYSNGKWPPPPPPAPPGLALLSRDG